MHPASMSAERRAELRRSYAGSMRPRQVDFVHGVVFEGESGTSFFAMGFAGKAIKPAFNFRFRSAEARARHIEAWEKALCAKYDRVAARRAERSSDAHGCLKGTILCSSWGYEQTNIDFYEVTAVVSAKTIEMRKIDCCYVKSDDAAMSGRVMPLPGKYLSSPMRKRCTSSGVTLTSYSRATMWDGTSQYTSWYG